MLIISISTILACTILVGLYAVRAARLGRVRHERLGSTPGSALMPGWLVEAFYWALYAFGRSLARHRIAPDVITYGSLVLAIPSLPLIATGHFAIAALFVLAAGGLDALDGVVARATGRASAAGAVLDSFVDRIADVAPFIGLAIFYRHRVLTLAIPLGALAASSILSYARAKADIYGLELPNGIMRRHERIAYLALSLLLAPALPAPIGEIDVAYPATLAGVAIIGVTSFVAACVLVARTRAALAAAPSPDPPSGERGAVRPCKAPCALSRPSRPSP